MQMKQGKDGLNALLITGTGAGSGKTVVATALAAYWQTYYGDRPLAIFKPIQTGGGDREHYSRLTLTQSADTINPLYFERTLAPVLAAEQEGQRIRLETVWRQFEMLSQENEFVLVEAPQGFGSPLTYETTVADLAWDWRLPTVLVVPVGPEAIAQTVANVALAQVARVHLKGIIFNCIHPCSEQEIANWAPIDLIQSLTHKPVLGYLPHLKDPIDISKLAQLAANFELERLIPFL